MAKIKTRMIIFLQCYEGASKCLWKMGIRRQVSGQVFGTVVKMLFGGAWVRVLALSDPSFPLVSATRDTGVSSTICHPCGRPGLHPGLLASAWPRTSCCGYSGSDPMKWQISVSFGLPYLQIKDKFIQAQTF